MRRPYVAIPACGGSPGDVLAREVTHGGTPRIKDLGAGSWGAGRSWEEAACSDSRMWRELGWGPGAGSWGAGKEELPRRHAATH